MNGQQRPRRIVLSALAAALAVLVMAGGDTGVSAETKSRYPGFQGPDLAANCNALDEWEIDTAMYPECGPGGDETDECDAFSAGGCWLNPRPEWQEPTLSYE
jgi:hypothetical protein